MTNRVFTGTNYESMPMLNRSLILRILSKRESCTRVELASYVGLTQAGVGKIINELIEAGIVLERGTAIGKLGKRSISISLNREACKVLAVKIARRSYDVGVFQLGMAPVEKIHREIGLHPGKPGETLGDIISVMRAFIERYPDIKAIGVGVPGPYLHNKGRIALMSEFAGWEEINIIDELSAAFDMPVIVHHDADASAFAEWQASTRNEIADRGTLVSLLISEGVGAGIIENGAILQGVYGTAGEVGHMSIDLNGPKCACGNRGCLELYTSALSFARIVAEELKDHPESSLYGLEDITAETVFEHMRKGDSFSIEQVKKVGRYLGYGITNIVYLYNPEVIVMTDIMTGGGDVLLEAAKEVVRERTLPALSENLEIRMTTLTEDAVLAGAAALAADGLLKDPSRLYARQ